MTPACVELRAAATRLRRAPGEYGSDTELVTRWAFLLEQAADLHPTAVITSPPVKPQDMSLTCECGVTYRTVLIADLGCPALAAAVAVARRITEPRGGQ